MCAADEQDDFDERTKKIFFEKVGEWSEIEEKRLLDICCEACLIGVEDKNSWKVNQLLIGGKRNEKIIGCKVARKRAKAGRPREQARYL